MADQTPITELLRRGVLDAELAALAWRLVEGGIPLVVAVPVGRMEAGAQFAAGLVGSFRPDVDVDAEVRPLTPAGASALVRGRLAAGVVEADSLIAVRERLGGGPLPLSADQLTFLGLVVVLGPMDAARAAGPLRVTAAHYVRPLARDAHGHPQRLDPAVLATWAASAGRYEHFAWGVLPEIAARLGQRTGDLESDLHHRRDDLAGLASAGLTDLVELRRLVAGYRARYGGAHGPSN